MPSAVIRNGPKCLRIEGLSIFREFVVRVVIQPALAGFRRGDHRVTAGARVLGRVAVRRVVAAQRGPAVLTCPQVDPLRANLHAFIALVALRVLDIRNRGQM